MAPISPHVSAIGMKSPGRTTRVRVAPADERLNAPQRSGSQCEQRLVEEEELVVGDGPAQVEVEIVVVATPACRSASKMRKQARPAPLASYKAMSACRRSTPGGQRVGRDDGADTGGDGEVGALPHEALADSSHRSTGDQACVGLGTQVGVQQNELVPRRGPPCHCAADPDRRRPTSASTASPASWPNESLMALKLSRSTKNNPTRHGCGPGLPGLGQAVHERQPVATPVRPS